MIYPVDSVKHPLNNQGLVYIDIYLVVQTCKRLGYKNNNYQCIHALLCHSPRLFCEVIEVRLIVEFEELPCWFLNASKNWEEYKMPLVGALPPCY